MRRETDRSKRPIGALKLRLIPSPDDDMHLEPTHIHLLPGDTPREPPRRYLHAAALLIRPPNPPSTAPYESSKSPSPAPPPPTPR
eukprot:CAMPEP_0184725600 /NCGR_PEP_ID=MMETSP0314-20130426/31371_1 /TAXON_ID=38298 /ORGANISM="Rhodella maculata, Strain CCMP 736" /LENGTH=84 /DNA_ID=CAMNT_0027190877 /DNA_START=51 /DNA_END=305 /DNA_ORIENTATION=+